MNKILQKRSWKTTGAGLAAIMTVVGAALTQLTDGNPATNPDWSIVLPAVASGFGLMFARDNDKSSEEVGAQ
jgi:hypothetical protein